MACNSTAISPVDCKNSLIEGLSSLFDDETTSDITLVVGSSRYHLHKNILAASSQYFHRMFYGGQWKESTKNEIVLHETPDCEGVFDTFIRYFYTGEVNLCPETAPHLLLLADKYDCKVKRNCLKFMTDVIIKGNLEKALLWIPICDKLGAAEVLERCYVIVCYNLKMASEMPHWSSLSAQHVSTILQRAGIIVDNEYEVYLAVQGWILSQKQSNTDNSNDLLALVQFKNMTASHLVQIEKSTLATDQSQSSLKQHLNDAFRHLAIKAESSLKTKEAASRFYTATGNLQTVTLQGYSVSGAIKPQCRGDFSNTYKWMLSFVQNKNGTLCLRITVPDVSREIEEYRHRGKKLSFMSETYYLHDDIPGKVSVSVNAILQNDQGIIYDIGTKSVNTSMPTANGGTVVEFPLATCYKPAKCFVSFKIEN
ncbi:BTB/POZ domain-containing protein 17-like [Amphiura filiformis]|uniref:BTB/POZ domain-containing protein 17-like n=1 Tax=Amphiura filiformis TaxID=82378 RepID=UPI003B2207F9